MSSRVGTAESSRVSCPGGRCLPSFIHQVILALKMAWDADWEYTLHSNSNSTLYPGTSVVGIYTSDELPWPLDQVAYQ